VIEDLKPYPETRDSGLAWLGEIPAHWEIKRGKSYLEAIDQRSESGHEELLTVSSTRGVVPRRSANVTMFKAKSYAGHKLCWPGDLVINSLWAWNGGLGVSQHHGIVSTAYGVYRARNSTEVNPHYLHDLLRSSAFQWELQVRSKGVWISRLQLTDTAFLDAAIPMPPPVEQEAIARFLAWATNRLDRAIKAKRRIIALLNEQKQAIIHRAVTRGLDPSVPLKDSGVPWLGEIPEHWELRPLGHAVRLQTGYPFASTGFVQVESGTRLLRGVNVTPAHIRWDEVVRWQRSIGDGLDDYALQVGDVVLGLDRPIIGPGVRATKIRKDDTPSLLLQRVARLRSTDTLDSEFLLVLLRGRPFREYIAPIFTGVSVPHLSPQQIKNFRVALPPLEEQRYIVAQLMEQTSELSTAISRLEGEITLLREYRTRLIADVVTGKLDVREVATGLPEPTESIDGLRNSDYVESDNDDEIEETESMD